MSIMKFNFALHSHLILLILLVNLITSDSFFIKNSYRAQFEILSSASKIDSVVDEQLKTVKILCLHGYLSNSQIFKESLRHLINATSNIADYVFLDGPHTLSLPNIDIAIGAKLKRKRLASSKYRWWNSVVSSGRQDQAEAVTYEGLGESLRKIAEIEATQGPFDLLLGFSQGAAMITVLSLLQEYPDFFNYYLKDNSNDNNNELVDNNTIPVKLPKPLLSILLNGFLARDSSLEILYRTLDSNTRMNQLPQKTLHILSIDDEVVPNERSLEATQLFLFPMLKFRYGGHEPPTDEDSIEFITKKLKNVWRRKYEQ